MEVFMDDFSMYGLSFVECLTNLSHILARCVEMNLILNQKKNHFMMQESIILKHYVSNKGIEVYKVKIEVIERLPPPKDVE